MNRPIKFRAWDKNDRRFLSENDNVPNFLNLVPCQSTGQFIPMYMEIAESYIYDTDIILMQYTGLKDRNSKEIYEGDIVDVWYPTRDYVRRRKVVAWRSSRQTVGFNVNGHTRYEVIGNIYESGHLLENEKDT